MRRTLKAILVGGTLGFLLVFGYIAYETYHLPKIRPLNSYLFIFDTGESKELLGDSIEQRGSCTVVITNEKPIVWLCNIPHAIVSLGPKLPAPPAPEQPAPTPTNKERTPFNERT